MSRSRAPKSDHGKDAADAVCAVRDEWMVYVRLEPPRSRPKVKAALAKWKMHSHELVAQLPAPDAAIYSEHKIRRVYVSAVLEKLCSFGGQLGAYSGRLDPIVPVTHYLLHERVNKDLAMSERHMRRALRVLAALGIVLYDRGRARHISLVGFPSLLKDTQDRRKCLRVLEAYAPDAPEERPGWWEPVRLTLLARAEGSEMELAELRALHEAERKADREREREAVKRNAAGKPMRPPRLDPKLHAANEATRERRVAAALRKKWAESQGKSHVDSVDVEVLIPVPEIVSAAKMTGLSGPEEGRASPERHSPAVLDLSTPFDGPEGEQPGWHTVHARRAPSPVVEATTTPAPKKRKTPISDSVRSLVAEARAAASAAGFEPEPPPKRVSDPTLRAKAAELLAAARAGKPSAPSSGPSQTEAGCTGVSAHSHTAENLASSRPSTVHKIDCQPSGAGSFSRCGEISGLLSPDVPILRTSREPRLTVDSRPPSLRVVRSPATDDDR